MIRARPSMAPIRQGSGNGGYSTAFGQLPEQSTHEHVPLRSYLKQISGVLRLGESLHYRHYTEFNIIAYVYGFVAGDCSRGEWLDAIGLCFTIVRVVKKNVKRRKTSVIYTKAHRIKESMGITVFSPAATIGRQCQTV